MVAAVLLLCTINVGLRLLPFLTVRRFLITATRTLRPSCLVLSDRIAWAVETAGRVVPNARCLTQALAAQTLLVRAGYPAHLRIGVARSAGQFEAHAWLEDEGRVIFGTREPVRYVSLPALDLLD
jgi:hypothetical protein